MTDGQLFYKNMTVTGLPGSWPSYSSLENYNFDQILAIPEHLNNEQMFEPPDGQGLSTGCK